MTSILPTIPSFIFTVFEPLSLLAGFIGTIADPQWFVAEQIVFSHPETLSPNATVVALQLGNMFLLASLVAFGVLYATTEPKVVRNYLIALWLGDIGHLAVTYYVMGVERFLDIVNWNAMAWGNIAITIVLFLSRTAYLTGLFGPDKIPLTLSQNKKLR